MVHHLKSAPQLHRTKDLDTLIVPAQEHFSLSRHGPIKGRDEYSGLAVDLTRLATVYLRIGEIDRGVTIGRRALNAVAAVPGSVRLEQRLVPLQQETAGRRNSATCQDFAKALRAQL